MGPTDRVVILIDMDCFYCQVEEKLNPELKDKPIAVVQYNAWRGGGIIAVNYPARDEGVTRHMRGNEAKKKCPSIRLVTVPEVRGKADLTKYRDAGKEVADVLATFTPLLQRASVDEAYLDITESVEKRIAENLNDLTVENLSNTFVVGADLKDFLHNVIVNKDFSSDKLKLAVGGLICEEIRHEVFVKTGYKCSAGIAHNKILAKLVCSLHKPNKQTILPQDAVETFFETMPINKIKNLGGKFGQKLSDDFHITYMGQLATIPEKDLLQKYDEKTANWLYNVARGVDTEPVTTKLISKSIACCKNFAGITALTTAESVEHWLQKLAEEMEERLEKDLKENNRKAKQVIVSFTHEVDRKDVNSSRTIPLISYSSQKIAQAAFEVIKKFCLKSDGSYRVKFMGLNASNFEDIKKVREITSFFQVGQSKTDKKNETQNSGLESKCSNTEDNCNVQGIEDGGNSPKQGNKNGKEKKVKSKFKKNSSREITNFLQFGQSKRDNTEQDAFQHDCEPENATERNMSESEVGQKLENVTPDSPIGIVENNFKKPLNVDTDASCSKKLDMFKVGNENNSPQKSGAASKPNKPSSFFEKYFVKDPLANDAPETSMEFETLQFAKNENDENNDPLPLQVEDSTNELCPECQKIIPLTELMSHQDYHFALKLSKGDTTPSKPEIKAVSGKKRGRSKSRKGTVETNNTLTTFFKKEEDVDSTVVTETCQECNKKIRIDEISSHMDYHAAKRIHLEINAIKLPAKPTSKMKRKKTKTQTPNQSVTSFFKPS